MSTSKNNFVDIRGVLSNHNSWNSVLLFRGVQACKITSGGEYQPFNWYPPRLMGRGDNDHKISFSELKVVITVLVSSSCNSLASYEGGYLKKFYFLLGSQKQLVWAVVYYYPSLFVNLESKEGVMSTENQEAIILLDKFNSAELYEIKKICNSHNLSVMTVIYHFKQHDVGIYKEIIKYITRQKKPPVVVIDSNTALFPQCIMSCSVLGTLEEMQLAEIHTYSKDDEKDELILDKSPMFDLLTEATYQLRAIEAMCEEKEKRDAKGGKLT